MVTPQDGFMYINPEYKEKADYIPINDTYAISGYTYGLFHDVISLLGERLNFTCQMYTQKHVTWGRFHKYPNGTVNVPGWLKEIYWNTADISVSSIAMSSLRVGFIKFLHPIGSEDISIVIPRRAISEELDYALYLSPLHLELWLFIIGLTTIISLMESISVSPKKHYLVKVLGNYWTTLMSYFGKDHHDNGTKVESYKIITFTSLMTGYIVWSGYNAFLTTELLDIKDSYPFTDLESLTQTDWRLDQFQ